VTRNIQSGMPYLELSSQQRIFYEIDDCTDAWKTPDTVVMIHGFTENTAAYRAWVPHLARNYRVIRFDQLGFGQSSAVADDFTFTTELLVDNVARLINGLVGGRAHIVGAKSGGLIALELAAMRPDLVKTITLASTPLDAPQPQKWLAHMDEHGMRSWARMTMPPRLGSGMPPRGIDWWVDMMGKTALATAHVYLRWVSTINVAQDLHKVKCPALVLTTATPRRAYSKTDVELYKEGLPHAEIAAIEVDGYHVSGTAPDESARITLGFLKKHTAVEALSDAGGIRE
jgi:pimeloyl-ACP methyl ester carboxylesterase